MPLSPSISFVPLERPRAGTAVLVVGEGMKLGPVGRALNEVAQGAVEAAAKVAAFTGKANATVELIGPRGLQVDRLVLAGLGKAGSAAAPEWLKLGGAVMGKLTGAGEGMTIVLESPEGSGDLAPELAAEFAIGLQLRAYKFERYKTKKKDDNGGSDPSAVKLAVADPAAAEQAFGRLSSVAEGVVLARDLVNEPANHLGPVELAGRAEALRELGVEVEVLTEREMAGLGMRALLAVAQGSDRPPRLVTMRWNGGGGAEPIAFVGKGVVFDTGGISIKSGQGMEDMKGDMAGAAAVVGLMRALAGRKAQANVVAIVGLVENMPDGKAQRPGDIVKTMSGTTVEIINTDAEGRLVLADSLWYCQDRFKPRLIVDLATLTGGIVVALGHEQAGLFSNDDELADRLLAAGKATGERLWRMPLASEYDKMIDSKVADIKNSAGRNASSVTAAHFLQRFVKDTPWAHLDIAGVALGSPQTEINRSWSSGFGVRLLDRLVADHYEG
jgi:leucyl aminopeptidase